jgi:hypothetical protein
MCTGSLSRGQTRWGAALTTYPHLVMMLKKEYSYTSTNLWFYVMLCGDLYLYSQIAKSAAVY